MEYCAVTIAPRESKTVTVTVVSAQGSAKLFSTVNVFTPDPKVTGGVAPFTVVILGWVVLTVNGPEPPLITKPALPPGATVTSAGMTSSATTSNTRLTVFEVPTLSLTVIVTVVSALGRAFTVAVNAESDMATETSDGWLEAT
jgi:hypothetical protein